MYRGLPKLRLVQNILLVVVICILTGAAIYTLAARTLSANVTDALTEIASLGAKNVERNVEDRLVLLETIAHLQRIQDQSVPIEEKIHLLDTEFKKEEFLRMSIADLNGHSLTTDGKELNIADREYFQKALHGSSNVSDPLVSRADGKEVIIFAVPIKNDYKVVGVLYATYEAEELSRIVDEVQFGEQGKSFILNSQGKVIAQVDRTGSADGQGKNVLASEFELENRTEITDEMVIGQVGAAEYTYKGKAMFVGYAPIPYVNWSLGVTAQKNQLFRNINAILYFITGMVFVVVFAVGAVVFYSRYLRKRLNREVAASTAAIDTAGLILLGLDHNGTIVEFNRYAEEKTCLDRAEVVRCKTIFDLVEPSRIHMVQDLLEEIKEGGELQNLELPLIGKEGCLTYVLWNTSIVDVKRANYIELMGVDISSRVEYEKSIHHLAYFDALTGLPNRLGLEEKVEQDLAESRTAALLFMDMDNFKLMNDSFGHTFGDALLAEVAERIHSVASDQTTVARIAGDEFCVWVSDYETQDEIRVLADNLMRVLNGTFYIRGVRVSASASLGIALYPRDGEGFEELLKHSDIAMYSAKESGKRRYAFFDQELNDALVEKVKMEHALRKALEENEFILHYQPQVDVITGKITGFEALIRWNSPTLGLVPPSRFIELAEETGLIVGIGKWVLKSGCSFMKKFHDAGFGNLSLSVNVSVVQLLEEDFDETVLHIMKETGLEARFLELEITETILMKSIESNIKKVTRLMEQGVKIALDDFGKGYSSLTYLKKLPISLLKIDKEFIDDILEEGSNDILLDGIITIAHKFGLKVVAEGVEKEQQLEYLKKIGCDVVQGYLFSKPLPKEEIWALFSGS